MVDNYSKFPFQYGMTHSMDNYDTVARLGFSSSLVECHGFTPVVMATKLLDNC